MEFPKYVEIIHERSLKLGQMIILSILIGAVWGALYFVASTISDDTSMSQRETCTVLSHKFLGLESAGTSDPAVILKVQCSFGEITHSMSDKKNILRYALKPSPSLRCFEKKYKFATHRGCDDPK